MSEETRSGVGWTWPVVLLVLSIGFHLLAPNLADPDLWGHVRFGRDILAAGVIPRVDPYSYLSVGHEWINHEWMAELTFGSLYEVGGPGALVAFKMFVALAIVGIVYRALVAGGLDPLRAGLGVAGVAFLLRPGLLTVRPHMFTYLFFAGVLFVLERSASGRRALLWLIPPMVALWVNFHGGVLAGVGVVVIWAATAAAAEVVRSGRERAGGGWHLARAATAFDRSWLLTLAGLTILTGLALLVNPYGWKLPDFLIRTATVPRPDITEWAPLNLREPVGVVYLATIGLTALAVLRSSRPRRAAPLTAMAVTAVLPFLAVRHVQLAVLAFSILGAAHFGDAFGRRVAEGAEPQESTLKGRIVFAGVCLLASVAFIATSTRFLGCIAIRPTLPVPAGAVDRLQAADFRGNLAVYFDWGEYVIWHLGPEVQVSMDGRRETVYPDSIYHEYLEFANGLRDWDALLELRPTDLALVPKKVPAFNLLTLKPGWSLVYEDSLGGVFAPKGPAGRAIAGLGPPTVPFNGAGLCFP